MYTILAQGSCARAVASRLPLRRRMRRSFYQILGRGSFRISWRCRKMSQFVASEKRSYLAVTLAGGATIAGAAEQCGVSRRTVERKLAQPKFRQLVADLR